MTVQTAPARPLTAADVMTGPAVTIAPTASVSAAWSLMLRMGLRHLLVATGGRCCGVINDRTLFAELLTGPLTMRHHMVRDLVPPRTTCVLPDSDVQMIARAMTRTGTDAVPVVESDGRLLGIVTSGDLVRAIAASDITLKETS